MSEDGGDPTESLKIKKVEDKTGVVVLFVEVGEVVFWTIDND